MLMLRTSVSILALTLATGCGGAGSATETTSTETGELTTAVDPVPVTIRLCEEPDDESLSAAVAAGFVPQVDSEGALVAIGVVVSGVAAEASLSDVENADCVVDVERSDQRVIIAPEAE